MLGSAPGRDAGGRMRFGTVSSDTAGAGEIEVTVSSEKSALGATAFIAGFEDRTTGASRAVFVTEGSEGTGITVDGDVVDAWVGNGAGVPRAMRGGCSDVAVGFAATGAGLGFVASGTAAFAATDAGVGFAIGFAATAATWARSGCVTGPGVGAALGAGDGGARACSISSARARAIAIVHSQSSSSGGAEATATGAGDIASAGETTAGAETGITAGGAATGLGDATGIGGVTGIGGGATGRGPASLADGQVSSSAAARSPSSQPTILPPNPSSRTAGRIDITRPSGVNTRPYLSSLTNPNRFMRVSMARMTRGQCTRQASRMTSRGTRKPSDREPSALRSKAT